MYKFDSVTNSFYPHSMQDDYIAAGSWPDGGVDVDENVFAEFSGNPPEGKVRGSSKKGYPVWVDEPPLTHEQHVAIAESQKQALIAEASEKTELWRTQLMLGIITEEDKASLKEWMLYVQEVQAVEPSLGAAVVWPIPPASPAR
ncbi:tail fiber assembly protein [Morganella morganii]|uniref:tail fiber assembly protein n=1 Tax=Morganella morganii TaxID=582 RepID=UPI0014193B02|nr:tail fiber assembly protein [Morganella morganii]NIH18902.1 tail fiber assembly protein [Morganella morganii]